MPSFAHVVHAVNSSYNDCAMNAPKREETLTLELLQEIDRQSDLTQRSLANHLDVALGLANAYLKRCIRKGLVKVKQAPPNRYLYYLTPKGFSEKSRLTAEYLRHSFDFYRQASDSMSGVMDRCISAGHSRLCLVGASELAEITLIRAREYPLAVSAVFDPACTAATFCGLPVLHDRRELAGFDACILTAITGAAAMRQTVTGVIDPARLLVPALLGLDKGVRA